MAPSAHAVCLQCITVRITHSVSLKRSVVPAVHHSVYHTAFVHSAYHKLFVHSAVHHSAYHTVRITSNAVLCLCTPHSVALTQCCACSVLK